MTLGHQHVFAPEQRAKLEQRRKELATLTFYLASGTIRIPYIAADKAEAVRDYVLYKVESSTQSWH